MYCWPLLTSKLFHNAMVAPDKQFSVKLKFLATLDPSVGLSTKKFCPGAGVDVGTGVTVGEGVDVGTAVAVGLTVGVLVAVGTGVGPVVSDGSICNVILAWLVAAPEI